MPLPITLPFDSFLFYYFEWLSLPLLSISHVPCFSLSPVHLHLFFILFLSHPSPASSFTSSLTFSYLTCLPSAIFFSFLSIRSNTLFQLFLFVELSGLLVRVSALPHIPNILFFSFPLFPSTVFRPACSLFIISIPSLSLPFYLPSMLFLSPSPPSP